MPNEVWVVTRVNWAGIYGVYSSHDKAMARLKELPLDQYIAWCFVVDGDDVPSQSLRLTSK